MPDLLKASSTFRRLAIFLILVSEPVAARSVRSVSISWPTSSARRSARMPSAPIEAWKSSPYSSTFARKSSSDRSWQRLSGVMPGSVTT